MKVISVYLLLDGAGFSASCFVERDNLRLCAEQKCHVKRPHCAKLVLNNGEGANVVCCR